MSASQQAYISKVHLKGYKSIRDLEIDFKPGLNIIIGPNGSGKTNFLELLTQGLELKFLEFANFFIRIEGTGMNSKRWENNTVTPKDKIAIEIDGIIKIGDKFNQILHLNKKSIINNHILNEIEFQMSYESGIYKTVMDLEKKEFNLPSITIEFGYPKLIFGVTQPSQFGEIIENGQRSRLVFDNKEMSQTFDYFFRHILTNTNFEVKSVKDISFEVSKNLIRNLELYTLIKNIGFDKSLLIKRENSSSRNYENIQLLFLVGNEWLRWNQLSDGTKRMFYIISKITCELENWDVVSVLIEEPELGIHPDQLYKLMDFIKEQSKEKQIIITTHSPEVLSILNKDEIDRIIVTRYDAEKGTQMHHLSAEKTRKAQIYIEETGDLSSFWVHSNLEEYDAEETKN